MALQDYQMRFRDLTLGVGTAYRIHKVDGLEDLDVRMGDVPLPRGVGDIQGLHTAAPRQIVLELAVTGEPRSHSLANAYGDLMAVLQPTEEVYPLYFKEPGYVERLIYVRPVGRQVTRDPRTTFGWRPVLARFKAADPRIYGTTTHSKTLNIYDPASGGLDFDVDYAKEFAPGTSTEVVLNNAGDAKAYPLIRAYGPASGTFTSLTLTNFTTGKSSTINSTLLSGQTLSADMRRIVTADPADTPYIDLAGSSAWGDWEVPREPFYLAPGDNLLRFEVTGTTTDSTCVLTWQDTWL